MNWRKIDVGRPKSQIRFRHTDQCPCVRAWLRENRVHNNTLLLLVFLSLFNNIYIILILKLRGLSTLLFIVGVGLAAGRDRQKSEERTET